MTDPNSMTGPAGGARLHVITGISASGKTTVGRRLADRFTPSAFVEGDVVRLMVRGGRQEMTANPTEGMLAELRLRYRQSAQLADNYVEAGYHVVVEDVIIGPMLAVYLDLLRTRPLHLVVLTPAVDVVARREAGRAKSGYGERWSIAQLDDILRKETPDLGWWLDTSDLTPDQTVDAILGSPGRSLLSGAETLSGADADRGAAQV